MLERALPEPTLILTYLDRALWATEFLPALAGGALYLPGWTSLSAGTTARLDLRSDRGASYGTARGELAEVSGAGSVFVFTDDADDRSRLYTAVAAAIGLGNAVPARVGYATTAAPFPAADWLGHVAVAGAGVVATTTNGAAAATRPGEIAPLPATTTALPAPARRMSGSIPPAFMRGEAATTQTAVSGGPPGRSSPNAAQAHPGPAATVIGPSSLRADDPLVSELKKLEGGGRAGPEDAQLARWKRQRVAALALLGVGVVFVATVLWAWIDASVVAGASYAAEPAAPTAIASTVPAARGPTPATPDTVSAHGDGAIADAVALTGAAAGGTVLTASEWDTRGEALHQKGQTAMAQQFFRRAYQLDPKSPHAAKRLNPNAKREIDEAEQTRPGTLLHVYASAPGVIVLPGINHRGDELKVVTLPPGPATVTFIADSGETVTRTVDLKIGDETVVRVP
jgi:hypothetical protein